MGMVPIDKRGVVRLTTETGSPGSGEVVAEPIVDAAEAVPYASKEEYDAAIGEYLSAKEAYDYTTELLMDDAQYDALVARIRSSEAVEPSWTSPQSPSVTATIGTGGDVVHSTPMLSLDNVFNEDELRAWLARLEKVLGHAVERFTVEPKLDGLALSALYRNGRLVRLATRGSGTAGEDVTHAASRIQGLPLQLKERVTVEVRGEVFMSDADFAAANVIREQVGESLFANPRNGAAGSLRAQDREYDLMLSFYAYAVHGVEGHDLPEVARESHSGAMGFVHDLGVSVTGDSTAGMPVCSTSDEVVAAVVSIGERRAKLGFAVDGAVVKADLAKDRDEAGFSSRAPRWGIAYKYPADTRTTVLLDIDLDLGRTGLITPRAVLQEVQVGGVKITSATLHNPDEVARKDVRVGDTVWVRRAGEVIPEVVSVKLDERPESAVSWVPPVICPRCGGRIDKSQKRWRCERGRLCGAAESLEYFASRDAMDIEGLGSKLVASLVAANLVADPSDLYRLKVEDLAGLDRMGETSAKKVLEELEKSKSQPLSRVLTGLGIRMTGRSMSRRLARHFGTLEAFRAASVDDLMGVEGVGKERAATIRGELDELGDVIDALVAAGLSTTEPGSPALAGERSADAPPLPFQGPDGKPLSVVVTGTVPGMDRTSAKEAVVRLGGKDSGSVSKKTGLVFVGPGAGAKETKARELLPAEQVMSTEDFARIVAEFDAASA